MSGFNRLLFFPELLGKRNCRVHLGLVFSTIPVSCRRRISFLLKKITPASDDQERGLGKLIWLSLCRCQDCPAPPAASELIRMSHPVTLLSMPSLTDSPPLNRYVPSIANSAAALPRPEWGRHCMALANVVRMRIMEDCSICITILDVCILQM
jgi:hypothetical protein